MTTSASLRAVGWLGERDADIRALDVIEIHAGDLSRAAAGREQPTGDRGVHRQPAAGHIETELLELAGNAA
jgi:hypothetical protein